MSQRPVSMDGPLHRRGALKAVRGPRPQRRSAPQSWKYSNPTLVSVHEDSTPELCHTPELLSVDHHDGGYVRRDSVTSVSSSSRLSMPRTPEPVFPTILPDHRHAYPSSRPILSLVTSSSIPNSTITFPSPYHGDGLEEDIDIPIVEDESPAYILTPQKQLPAAQPFPTTSELRAEPSILLRRWYTTKRHTPKASIAERYQELRGESDAEFYEGERVREHRMQMAENLLARRKAARKAGKRRSEEYYDEEEYAENWYDEHDRVARFKAWEEREALAFASERQLEYEHERARSFRDWDRAQQSQNVRRWLAQSHSP